MFSRPPIKPKVNIPLSDVIRIGEAGKRRLQRSSGGISSKSSVSRNASAELKLPKLPLTRDRFRSTNPSSDKLPDTPFLPPFENSSKKVGGSNWRRPASATSDDEVDETMKKVKGFLEQRKNVVNVNNSKLDSEIHSRISKAYDSMQTLEKGFKTFDDTLKLAKGRVISAAASGRSAASIKNVGGTLSPRGSRQQVSARKPMKHIDVTRQVKAMFGLDPMTVVASSEEDDDSGDEVEDGETDYLEAMTRGETDSIGGKADLDVLDLDILDLEIPTVIDKRFMNRHHKRELRLSKELSGMKSQLEVLNLRTEREARRNKLKRVTNKLNIERPRNLTRLMAYDPNKGPAKELTDFLQSTGGATGAWDHEDHSIFLQSYMKWKHRPSQVVDYVAKQCPAKNLEDVASHLTWYEKYDTLNKANKAHVRQWQISKRRERETMFQMAEQNHRAKIEGNKSRQELIRATREEEKERERIRLHNWKKSQPEVKNKNVIKSSSSSSVVDRISQTMQLNESLKASKTRLLTLLPENHELHKVLAKKTSSTTLKPKAVVVDNPKHEVKKEEPKEYGRSPPESPVGSHASSGIFSDQEVDSEYEKELRMGIGDMSLPNYDYRFGGNSSDSDNEKESGNDEFGGGDKARTKLQAIQAKVLKAPLIPAEIFKNSRRGANKEVIAGYQAKDAAMIQAKRQAILDKTERQRNKTYLTSDEAKRRVLRPTKGWKMKKNVRDQEMLQSVGREVRRNDKDLYHNEARVESPRMFKPAPNIKLIPKLGAKGWRQY